MSLDDDLPITDAAQVGAFLDRLPLAVDRERFTRFVLGFPHRYLTATLPAEVLKHFVLVESLGGREAISTLAPLREGGYKLVVVARDRHALFARIAGSVAAVGANIVRAEAIANTQGLVLDTFLLSDRDDRLGRPEDRRRLQGLIEEAVRGAIGDAPNLPPPSGPLEPPEVRWGDGPDGTATVLYLRGPDSLGLLGRIAQTLASCGCDIGLAHIDTPGGQVEDELHLTFEGRPLTPGVKRLVEAAIAQLGS
jgi:[protein-PII] uridylyltransferase